MHSKAFNKEEMAWATDKRWQVIYNILLNTVLLHFIIIIITQVTYNQVQPLQINYLAI